MNIKSIGANIVQRINSPLTKKTTSTNPFEHNNFSGKVFKGSVLPFADVFQVNKVKEASKLKMMSASVVGAISNFGHRVSQPIVNFARNIKTRINSSIVAIKSLPSRVNEISKNVSTRISESINNRFIHKQEAQEGVHILSLRQINTKASISDLKSTWVEENRLEALNNVAKAGL